MDTASQMSLVVRAIEFAAKKHRTQKRKDVEASPYINHPIGLMHVLCVDAGISDPLVLAAAALHDTIEDTQTTRAELEAEFGSEIAAIVAVTDDKSLPKMERKGVAVDGRDRAVVADEDVAVIDVADDEAGLVQGCNEPRDVGRHVHEEAEVCARKGAHAPARAIELVDAARILDARHEETDDCTRGGLETIERPSRDAEELGRAGPDKSSELVDVPRRGNASEDLRQQLRSVGDRIDDAFAAGTDFGTQSEAIASEDAGENGLPVGYGVSLAQGRACHRSES